MSAHHPKRSRGISSSEAHPATKGPSSEEKPRARLASVVPLSTRRASLQVVVLVGVDGDRLRARFADGEEVTVHPGAVDPIVLRGAAERSEPVIVQDDGAQLVVLGALRTRPTPGIDRAEEYVIEAGRVKIEVAHDIALVAGAAQIAIRAVGLVETIARNITARAAGVHKLVGRMIHLN